MNAVKLIVVWLWVAIPLGWGVKKSVEKSLPLFSKITAVRAGADPIK